MAIESNDSRSELAFAKLTLSFRIVGVRPDGYHLILSEMTSVSLADEVALVPGDAVEIEDPSGRIAESELRLGRIPRDGNNIAMRALHLLGKGGGVRISKAIPAGAGLGGGSADAAAVLRILDKVDCTELALELGADVPFCLRGGRAIVQGVGERVSRKRFEHARFLLLLPPFSISTPMAYAVYDEIGAGTGPNDLEKAAFHISSGLKDVAEFISRLCEERLSLAGSGSTLFVPGALNDHPRLKEKTHTQSGRNFVSFGEIVVEIIEVSTVEGLA